jgi:hypothetical protein
MDARGRTVSEPNPVIGSWQCSEGGSAEVKQTKKRGRHFYTQCECCGLQQGTGAALQQRIWDEAEFLPGVAVVRPSNVLEKGNTVSETGASEPAKATEPASEPEPKAPGDFDPNEPEPISEPEPTQSGFSGAKIIAGLALLAAAGVGAWMG